MDTYEFVGTPFVEGNKLIVRISRNTAEKYGFTLEFSYLDPTSGRWWNISWLRNQFGQTAYTSQQYEYDMTDIFKWRAEYGGTVSEIKLTLVDSSTKTQRASRRTHWGVQQCLFKH